MKCKDCDADMEELLDNLLRKLPARSASWEENMAVLVRGYFVAKNGRRVSLCICPKCGRVQGEWAIDSPLQGLPVGEISWKAPKRNGRVVKYY